MARRRLSPDREAAARVAAIERLVQRMDAALFRLEGQTTVYLMNYVRRQAEALEAEIQQRWPQALADVKDAGEAQAYVRARMLLAELQTVMVGVGPVAQTAQALDYFAKAHRQALDDAMKMLQTMGLPGDAGQLRGPLDRTLGPRGGVRAPTAEDYYDPTLLRGEAHFSSVGPDWEVLSRASRRAVAVSINAEGAWRQAVADSVVNGLIRGWGPRKVAAELQANYDQAYYKVERAVRTEMHRVYDETHQQSYKESGLRFVQRIAVMDNRTCEYCSYRAGEVYVIGEAPAALHPNDRCYMLPWDPNMNSPEWEKWVQDHRAEAIERVTKAGKVPSAGRAPFERMEGKDQPTPVWFASLDGGDPWTNYGRQVLTGLGIWPGQQAAPTTTKRGEFVPRSVPPPADLPTMESFETYLKEQLRIRHVDAVGIHPSLYRPIAFTLHELQSRFPDAFRHMSTLTTHASKTTPGHRTWRGGTIAHVVDGHVMGLNPQFFGSEAGFEHIRAAYNRGFLTTPDAVGTVVHEFAHVMAGYLKTQTTAADSHESWWRHLSGANVSEYSNSVYWEAHAEAFAAIMRGTMGLADYPIGNQGDYHFAKPGPNEGRRYSRWPPQVLRYYEALKKDAERRGWQLPELPARALVLDHGDPRPVPIHQQLPVQMH